MLTQGFHGLRRGVRALGWLLWAASLHGTADAAVCTGPAVTLAPLAPGLWWVAGAAGDSDAQNRGVTSNLLIVHERGRTWLLGAGPTPAFGKALACHLKARTGWVVSDVIAPWPRPELVLGQAGFPAARSWAHAQVADAMHERCPRCVARMRLRLAAAASDLGPDAIRRPGHRLQGEQGTLGPFQWWLLRRAETTPVTVFRLRDRPLWVAHGLLWGEGPPDLRDAELPAMAASFSRLAALAAPDGPAARWLPEQGPWQPADAAVQHAAYLRALEAAVRQAQQRGALETDLPAHLPGTADVMTQGLRHGLNWQRAWHLLEGSAFDDLANPASAAAR